MGRNKKEQDFIASLIDKYGDDILVREYVDGHPTISTGSTAIDISTGIGGIPVGRYSEIYGPESGGKTTLCLLICKHAILNGLKCLYIDVENSLDASYAKLILGDLFNQENIVIVQPGSAEKSFELAEYGIDSGFRCIIFDSVAALSPEEEIDKDYGKQSIALGPRLTNQFLRKTRHKIREKEIAFIFTNQVRANIGSYVGGYITPAGFALKHYTSLRIMLSKSSGIKGGEHDVGNIVTFIIKKNKIGIPYRQAETVIIYGKGVDFNRDLLKFSVMLGVVTLRGPYFYFNDESIGQGDAKASEYLNEHPDILDKIVKQCYNVAGVKLPIRATGKETNDGM